MTDLPYGTIKGLDYNNCKSSDWDNVIDTKEIFDIAERILRPNGKMLLFAQQPFTNELINNSRTNLKFTHSLVWVKNSFSNPLMVKKAKVNLFEDILLFTKVNKYDNFTDEKNPLRGYSSKIVSFIGLPLSKINKKMGGRIAEHFIQFNGIQFSLCTEKICAWPDK